VSVTVNKTQSRQLSQAPGTLGLSLRAALPLLPGASLLPFVAGGGRELPDLELTLQGVQLQRERLAAYNEVCGFPLSDVLPGTAPHLLAFPLHMALMTSGSFPFGPVGLVHLSNRIRVLRAIDVSEPLDVSVRTTPLSPHPKGRAFTLLSEISIDGELVWEEQSTMLRRGKSDEDATANARGTSGDGAASAPAERGAEREALREATETAQWRLPEGLGRSYAGVSGDRNPIHMHALSAKLFGFPRAIAHGMWTKARCLAALAATLPDAYEVEVSFRKPILLPGSVGFAELSRERRTAFAVRSGGNANRIHLEGTVTR
jgi:acyl dehydratase